MSDAESPYIVQDGGNEKKKENLWNSCNWTTIVIGVLILVMIYNIYIQYCTSGFLGETVRADPQHDPDNTSTNTQNEKKIEDYIEELKLQQRKNIS